MRTLLSDSKAAGLEINIQMTKTVTFGQECIGIQPLSIETKEIENVDEFVYLESTLACDNNDCSAEISNYSNHVLQYCMKE